MEVIRIAINEYKINETNNTVVLLTRNRKGQEFEILIDLDDLDKIKELDTPWHTVYRPGTNSYYPQSSKYIGIVNGRYKYDIIQLQRFIMNAQKGDYVDHLNHKTLDCRKSNLRITTHQKNTKHRNGANSNNTSGYRNVSFVGSKWLVQLQVDGKNTRLGAFDNVHEAGAFAEKMRLKHYGNYAGRSIGVE